MLSSVRCGGGTVTLLMAGASLGSFAVVLLCPLLVSPSLMSMVLRYVTLVRLVVGCECDISNTCVRTRVLECCRMHPIEAILNTRGGSMLLKSILNTGTRVHSSTGTRVCNTCTCDARSRLSQYVVYSSR